MGLKRRTGREEIERGAVKENTQNKDTERKGRERIKETDRRKKKIKRGRHVKRMVSGESERERYKINDKPVIVFQC